MNKDKLKNQVAIITGASSGIGRATALALAKRGVRIALGSRNSHALQNLAKDIHDIGSEALVITTDVSQQEQVIHLVNETIDHWGQVDLLISNAGQYIRRRVEELDIPIIEKSMEINFYGGIYAVMAALPHMLGRRSGHIFLITSLDGKIGLPPDAPYVAAKFALTGFAEVLRQEIALKGIYTTTVLPGRVDTPMIEELEFKWITAKISPEAVAKGIIKCIKHPRPELILPQRAYLLLYAKTLFPSLGDWAVRYFRLDGWESSERRNA